MVSGTDFPFNQANEGVQNRTGPGWLIALTWLTGRPKGPCGFCTDTVLSESKKMRNGLLKSIESMKDHESCTAIGSKSPGHVSHVYHIWLVVISQVCLLGGPVGPACFDGHRMAGHLTALWLDALIDARNTQRLNAFIDATRCNTSKWRFRCNFTCQTKNSDRTSSNTPEKQDKSR